MFAACVDGDTVGQLTSDFPYSQDTTPDKGFLLTDVIGEVQCYGVIKVGILTKTNNKLK